VGVKTLQGNRESEKVAGPMPKEGQQNTLQNIQRKTKGYAAAKEGKRGLLRLCTGKQLTQCEDWKRKVPRQEGRAETRERGIYLGDIYLENRIQN